MKKYAIEYHFGPDDVVKQIVISSSEDLELIYMNNMKEDRASFIDYNGAFCTFNYSAVQYIRVYPWP